MNVNKILWYINIPDGLSPSVSSPPILEGLEEPVTKRSFSLHDMKTAQPRIYAVLCFVMLPLPYRLLVEVLNFLAFGNLTIWNTCYV